MRAVKGSLGHSLENELGKLGRITYIVGRARWKINEAPSLRDNERAWRDQVKGLVRRDGAENLELNFGSVKVQDSSEGVHVRKSPVLRVGLEGDLLSHGVPTH